MIEIIKREFRRRMLEESFQRIQQCVSSLTDEELWKRPNENLVSVANLILHLNGNITQWIISGVGGIEDRRERALEFSTLGGVQREELLNNLNHTISKSIDIINALTENQLTEKRTVQGFEETVGSIIIHVIEHMSYHTGQITYYTKMVKNIDTAYYGGLDLEKTN